MKQNKTKPKILKVSHAQRKQGKKLPILLKLVMSDTTLEPKRAFIPACWREIQCHRLSTCAMREAFFSISRSQPVGHDPFRRGHLRPLTRKHSYLHLDS